MRDVAANNRILVADDEPDVLHLVSANLRNAGYEVVESADGPSALSRVRESPPALIVLDLMLPEMSGLEVCRLLKKEPATHSIPIIMLTAKASEVDRIVGFELGADDYVTKPFSPRELVLRVKSVLRRTGAPVEVSQFLTLGGISIDRVGCTVTVAGQPVDFTATELKLLVMLVERRGRVQSRATLLKEIWGYESSTESRTVDTHVRRVRGKLGVCANCIETLRGFGYRAFEAEC